MIPSEDHLMPAYSDTTRTFQFFSKRIYGSLGIPYAACVFFFCYVGIKFPVEVIWLPFSPIFFLQPVLPNCCQKNSWRGDRVSLAAHMLPVEFYSNTLLPNLSGRVYYPLIRSTYTCGLFFFLFAPKFLG